MGKEGFIIYKSFYEPIKNLSDKQLGRLFRALFDYQIDGSTQVDTDLQMAFAFFKNQMDIDEKRTNLYNKETFVYTIILECKYESFIKIGVSYFLDKRYSDYERLGFNVKEVYIEKYENKLDAEIREMELHEYFKDYKFIPKEKFAGYTECFTLKVLDHIG